MTPNPESCAVAFPRQRNNATSQNATTTSATAIQQIGRKPASIKELRAQLLAQQERNEAASIRATLPAKVAQSDAGVAATVLSIPGPGKWESDLIRDFMEIDGLSREQAEDLAGQCLPPRPAADWVAMIAELDELITSACNQSGLDDAARDRIIAGRKCQPLATIPATLQWFRKEISK